MYCESFEEQQLFDMLKVKFPHSQEFMLDIMAWTYINKPDRFHEIMEEHQNHMTDVMVELENIDYNSLMKKPE